nr:hypothetical protein L204_00167 [Cryptococcus depauperatus CBS 7855]
MANVHQPLDSDKASSGARILQKTDYPSLAKDYPEPSVRDVNIVGLELKVYGLEEIRTSDRPLVVMISCHGRMNSQKDMKYFAQGILGEISSKNRNGQYRDLVVVTLASIKLSKDQRNHGTRTVDRTANLAFDGNFRHLYALLLLFGYLLTFWHKDGGVHDVQLVMDFIGAYLFPNGERVIEEFVATGISLGGHVTWKLLHDDPRVRIGIPIIGLPFESVPIYLQARAESSHPPLRWEPPLYPPSLRMLIEPKRDERVEQECYGGKRILTMHGKEDTLVPYSRGEPDIKKIGMWVKKGGGICVIDVQEKVGHVCTIQMMQKTAEWVWIYALKEPSS